MRVLKVQGKGRVSVEPDVATLSFDVETKAKDYADCVSSLNNNTAALRADLVNAGLSLAELKTTAFSVRVDSHYKDGQRRLVGYCATHNLHIDVPADKDVLNRVLRQIAKGQSGAEIRLSFSVKDKDGLRQKVIANAVHTAKANAQILASAAGIKLGNLQQVDYGWAEVRISDYNASMICESMEAAPSEMNADIDPEDVEAEDNVTLIYEIVD